MFEELPSELIDGISRLVDKSDLLNLRLTCRQLQRESFQAYGAAFFSIVNLEFCVGTFPRFYKIASDEKLCSFVRELRIGHDSCRKPICESISPWNHRLGQGKQWPRMPSRCLDTSATTIRSFRSLLADRLIKCRSIYLSDESGTDPYDDGTESSLSVTDSVYLIFHAIAGLPISVFHMNLYRMSRSLQPRELPRDAIGTSLFISSWATYLTELQLDWDIGQDDLRFMAIDLISRAKGMRRLYLRTQISSKSNAFLSRLADASELPPLTHLVIGSLKDTEPAQLGDFISRFGPTLVSLQFTAITLLSGKRCAWSSVLFRCRSKFPRLECITMSICRHSKIGEDKVFCGFNHLLEWKEVPEAGNLKFLSSTNGGIPQVIGIRYEGKGDSMEKILHGLEECICSERAINHKSFQYPETLLVAGKLRADKIRGKKFDTVFDQTIEGI